MQRDGIIPGVGEPTHSIPGEAPDIVQYETVDDRQGFAAWRRSRLIQYCRERAIPYPPAATKDQLLLAIELGQGAIPATRAGARTKRKRKEEAPTYPPDSVPPNLDELPFSQIKKLASELGHHVPNTDTKIVLIEKINSGIQFPPGN